MKQVLPDGYDRFAIPYQCLKKGYGACLYANRRGACGGNNASRNVLSSYCRQQQQFLSSFSNRIVFMFIVVVLFFVFLFLCDRFLNVQP